MEASDAVRAASRVLMVLLAIVAIAIVAAIAGALVPDAAINPTVTRASAAGSQGVDPFTEDLRLVAEVPKATAAAVQSGEVGAQSAQAWTATEDACDTQVLVESLRTSASKRNEWLAVLDVSESDLANYISALMPATLNLDSVVMNHGFIDGRAQPVRTVLQAGTIVLVDDAGVPRVLCKCGNPLLTATPDANEEPIGEVWDDFDATTVVSIVAEPPAEAPRTPEPATSVPVPTPDPEEAEDVAAPPTPVQVPTVEPTPTPTTAPTSTATATATPEPAATPVPTATSLPPPPPTSTSVPTATPEPPATATAEPELTFTCRVDPREISRTTVFEVTLSWTPADRQFNTIISIGTTVREFGGSASPVSTGLQRFDDSPNFGAPIRFSVTGAENYRSGGPCSYTVVDGIADPPVTPTPTPTPTVECDPGVSIESCCPAGWVLVSFDEVTGDPVCVLG